MKRKTSELEETVLNSNNTHAYMLAMEKYKLYLINPVFGGIVTRRMKEAVRFPYTRYFNIFRHLSISLKGDAPDFVKNPRFRTPGSRPIDFMQRATKEMSRWSSKCHRFDVWFVHPLGNYSIKATTRTNLTPTAGVRFITVPFTIDLRYVSSFFCTPERKLTWQTRREQQVGYKALNTLHSSNLFSASLRSLGWFF